MGQFIYLTNLFYDYYNNHDLDLGRTVNNLVKLIAPSVFMFLVLQLDVDFDESTPSLYSILDV